MKIKLFYSLLFLIVFHSGFSQFHISRDSLIKQFEGSNTEQHIFVKGNDLPTVSCLDKNEKPYTLIVTNRTGIRIIQNDHSKVTFYFNTVRITDSTIGGSKTHFFNAPIKPVKFSNISKIEILK